MNEKMNEWMNERTNEQMNEWMNYWMNDVQDQCNHVMSAQPENTVNK